MIEKYKITSLWLFLPIAACILAVLPLSSTGYLAVRLVVSFSAFYVVFGWKEQVRIEWKLVFFFVGILFNPVFPIFLHSKLAWIAIDVVVAALFFSQLRVNSIEPSEAQGMPAISSSKNHSNIIKTSTHPIKHQAQVGWFNNVIKPLRLAVDSTVGFDEKIIKDSELRRWFLGYCCGFVFYKKNPKAAFAFAGSGMWVKQSYYGMLESSVPELLDEFLGVEEKSIFLDLFSADILFDYEWEDGYGYGIRDAEFWIESSAITQSLSRRLQRT